MPPLPRPAHPTTLCTARRAGLFAGLLALAACDQGPATVTPYKHPSGTFDFLIAATNNEGPLFLETDGNPFAGDGGLQALTVEIMEQALQSRALRLTTVLEEAEDPRFRLAVVFNPADKGELLAFCEHRPAGGTPVSEGRIDLRAGFCRGDDLLAAVDGWVEEVENQDDPRFEQLMKQVIRELFSRRQNDE